ncbi:MAG TPA: hypothetical protein VFJ15_04265 [Oleiagrimonas sp.]|nr:hypothetical protein [Oleiagrimonas sp.]
MSESDPVSKKRRYFEGLSIAASGNAQAFGYSILVTVSYGIASNADPSVSIGDQLAFAMSAVLAFSLLNLLVACFAGGESDSVRDKRILLVATATDFVAVGAGLAAAFGIAETLSGLAAWILIPFVAGLSYMLVQALEMAVGRRADAGESSTSAN